VKTISIKKRIALGTVVAVAAGLLTTVAASTANAAVPAGVIATQWNSAGTEVDWYSNNPTGVPVAGAAQAQSSVTVYGLLDLGYAGANQHVAQLQSATTAQQNTTSSTFNNSPESTSRLGFKGVEDLGGGTSAFFTVETGLTPGSANFTHQ